MVGDTHIFHLSCFAEREELFNESIFRFKTKHREAFHFFIFHRQQGRRKHEKIYIAFTTILLDNIQNDSTHFCFFLYYYCHYHSSLVVFGGDGGQTKWKKKEKHGQNRPQKMLLVRQYSLSLSLVLRLME